MPPALPSVDAASAKHLSRKQMESELNTLSHVLSNNHISSVKIPPPARELRHQRALHYQYTLTQMLPYTINTHSHTHTHTHTLTQMLPHTINTHSHTHTHTHTDAAIMLISHQDLICFQLFTCHSNMLKVEISIWV